jgi:hypothetical protein
MAGGSCNAGPGKGWEGHSDLRGGGVGHYGCAAGLHGKKLILGSLLFSCYFYDWELDCLWESWKLCL